MTERPDGWLRRLRLRFNAEGLFFRNVVTLLTGTLASRVIAVAAIPFLARLYSPEEFGVLALFLTVNTLIASVATGRYDMAMMLPDKDSDSAVLMLASVAIAAVFSAVVALLFWSYGTVLAAALGAPALADWLWLNPLMLLALCAYNALRSWASRKGEFASISHSVVAYTFVTVVTQLLLALPRRLGNGGLIIGTVVGQMVQTLMLLRSCLSTLRHSLRQRRADDATLGNLLYRYRRFAIFDTTANFLNATSKELPVILLGVFFSPLIVGFYSVGRRMLATPVQLVSNATSQVFFPKAREELAAGNLDTIARKLFYRLAVVGITPLLLVAVAVPEIVAVFLGDKWLDSSSYVRWLTAWLLALFIAAPFNQLFSVLEKQRERLVYVIGLTLLQLAALGYGGWIGDSVLAIALFSAGSCVAVLANCLWLLGKAGVAINHSAAILLQQMLLALPFVGGLMLARVWIESDLLRLGACALALGLFAAIRMRAILGRGSRAAA